jgi:hypothetical protein
MKEVKTKGTFKGHLKNMIQSLYLWTTLIKPEFLGDALKKELCFSYDKLEFKPIEQGEEIQKFSLMLDFGDMEVSYIITFAKSKMTKYWVFTNIE